MIMKMIMKLLKAAIGAALLSRSARNALFGAIARAIAFLQRPGTGASASTQLFRLNRAAGRRGISIGSLFRGALELAALRIMRRAGLSGSGIIPAIAAIFLAMMRGRSSAPSRSKGAEGDRVIEIDEYTVIDDRRS